MTPTERLQAAIDKLEQQRAAADEAPWITSPDDPAPYCEIEALPGTVAEVVPRANADLIVTLHRTIDAQLSLLRHAEKFLGTVGHHTSNIASPFIDDALTLADTILGTPALAEKGTPR